MTLSIADAIIIIFLILGGVVGFKNGAIKEGTRFIGLFFIIILSFALKDKLMVILYENLPFFNFFGIIRGLDSINVLLYQLVSFLIVFIALYFVLNVLIMITGLIEWLLKLTIFLSIPSKILGIVVGVVEYYVYIFIILYILSIPIFNLDIFEDSKLNSFILNKTPILSKMVDDTVNVYTDVWKIIKTRDKKSNREVNELVLKTLLDNHLITIESAEKLIQTNKIRIEDENMLNKYKKGDENLYD